MSFPDSDVMRVVHALDIDVNLANVGTYVKGGMQRAVNSAEETLPGVGGAALVAQIQAWLTIVEGFDSQLETGAADGALIQADVLKWSEKGRFSDVRKQRSRYAKRIAIALNLERLMPGYGQGNMLCRN